ERLHSALVHNPAAIAAIGRRALFDERGHHRMLPGPRRSFSRSVWADVLAGWMSPPGTVLWRAEVVRGVGGWAENLTLSEDRELLLRGSRVGPVVFVPDVVLDKRAHAGQRWAPDARRVQEEWVRAHLESLSPRDRDVGSRLSRTYRYLNDARIAHGNLRSREALSLYLRAIRSTPS